MMKKRIVPLMMIVAIFGTANFSHASSQAPEKKEPEKNTAKEVRQEVQDAAEAIGNYTADKREEAARKAKEGLDALDARINSLGQRIDRDWDKMDKAARERARKTMNALHEQRVKAAEWYGGLKNGTAKAWDHTKRGFSDAYKSLKQAWEKAEQEYREDGKRGCKNFCVNGHLAGNCRTSRENRNDRKQRTDRQPAG